MDRLTEYNHDGTILRQCFICTEPKIAESCAECDHIARAIDRLAEYEDTRYTPEDFDKLCRDMSDLRMALGLDTYDNLRKIIQADRLLVLPCAIGAPVFVHEQLCKNNPYTGCKYSQDCTRNPFIKCPLRVAERAFTLGMSKMLGKSCWLTKKEAEDAIPADRRP